MRTTRRLLTITIGSLAAAAALLPALPAEAAIRPDPVAGGLNGVAAFTWAPRGRIFYGERGTGEIRIRIPRTGHDHLFFHINNVVGTGERGLLGIALHPDYPDPPFVYAYVTRHVSGGNRNQIVRLRNNGGTGTNFVAILTLPSLASNHNGGRILFGRDGLLYVVIGDGANPALSQNRNVLQGKVLRLRPNGRAAPGNPFGNRVWAYGIRNSFGMGFDPQTGRLWETEAGPTCNDELNRIVRGGNFAWGPSEDCDTGSPPQNTNRDGPNRIMPRHTYNPVITPTGVAFCQGCSLGPANAGAMFVGAFNNGQLRRVRLGPSRFGVRGQAVVYNHGGPILSMERGPSGRIYFTDGGRIFRLVQVP
jgi:glucose/arabinose dehydrogenase